MPAALSAQSITVASGGGIEIAGGGAVEVSLDVEAQGTVQVEGRVIVGGDLRIESDRCRFEGEAVLAFQGEREHRLQAPEETRFGEVSFEGWLEADEGTLANVYSINGGVRLPQDVPALDSHEGASDSAPFAVAGGSSPALIEASTAAPETRSLACIESTHFSTTPDHTFVLARGPPFLG